MLFLRRVLIYAQLSKSLFHIILTASPEVVDVAREGWRVSFFLVLGRIWSREFQIKYSRYRYIVTARTNFQTSVLIRVHTVLASGTDLKGRARVSRRGWKVELQRTVGKYVLSPVSLLWMARRGPLLSAPQAHFWGYATNPIDNLRESSYFTHSLRTQIQRLEITTAPKKQSRG